MYDTHIYHLLICISLCTYVDGPDKKENWIRYIRKKWTKEWRRNKCEKIMREKTKKDDCKDSEWIQRKGLEIFFKGNHNINPRFHNSKTEKGFWNSLYGEGEGGTAWRQRLDLLHNTAVLGQSSSRPERAVKDLQRDRQTLLSPVIQTRVISLF